MLEQLKNLLKHKVTKNTIWIIGERIIQMILSFIITMISARYLGPSNYGILNYGASFVTFFSSITKLGIDSIIVNELINAPDEEGKILGSSIFLRFISSILSIIMIFGIISFMKPNNEIILITTLLQSISLIFQAIQLFDYWFQSKLKSKYVSIAKCIAYIVVSIYKLILLIKKASIAMFALSMSLDSLIIMLLLVLFYKKNNGQKLLIDMPKGMKLLKKSYHFIISSLMVVIYTQIDKIMIGNMLSDTAVGYYSAALALHAIFGFVPEAIIVSFRPIIFEAKKKTETLYYKRIGQTIAIVFWCCFGFALIMSIFSKLAISIVYGKMYISAKTPLIILLWAIPFSYLGSVRGTWIVAENLNKYAKKYVMWGAIVNIILNYLLIPKIGINGAAIATLITEFFVCIISPLMYKETRKFTKIIIKSIILKYNIETQ